MPTSLSHPQPHPARLAVLIGLGLLLVATPLASLGASLPFRAGDIVTTNFSLQNRLRWTNDNGQVFTPSNTAIRLQDFAGKIVFFCFFDVW